MQKGIGVILIVVGVLLLVWGHDVGNSIGSQFTKAFTGAPIEKARNLYISGTVSGLLGLLLVFFKK